METAEYQLIKTAWGYAGMVVRGGALVSFYLPARRERVSGHIRARWPDAAAGRGLLPRFVQAVQGYFLGKRARFDVPVDLTSYTPFQRHVLEACRKIPYGKTASYKDLACAVGSPQAARGVGGVMARNPLPLVVPCHRVLHADGSIGGFSSPEGIDEKRRLLELEGVLLPGLA